MAQESPHDAPRHPIAHCFATPEWLSRRDGTIWWAITIPVCPHCRKRHTHGGGTGPAPWTNEKTRSAGTRVPHCTAYDFIGRRAYGAGRDAALAVAQKYTGSTEQYRLVIDLPVPAAEVRLVLPALRPYLAIVNPPTATAGAR